MIFSHRENKRAWVAGHNWYQSHDRHHHQQHNRCQRHFTNRHLLSIKIPPTTPGLKSFSWNFMLDNICSQGMSQYWGWLAAIEWTAAQQHQKHEISQSNSSMDSNVMIPLGSNRDVAAEQPLQRTQAVRRTSHVTRHTSHVTRHTSQVTRHTPHITRHTSHATLQCHSWHTPWFTYKSAQCRIKAHW